MRHCYHYGAFEGECTGVSDPIGAREEKEEESFLRLVTSLGQGLADTPDFLESQFMLSDSALPSYL